MTHARTRPLGWLWKMAAVIVLGALPASGRAQTARCDALKPELQELKRSVFAALHPYDGCDETFEGCLARKPVHPVVLRLASDVCRHVEAGRSQKEIERLLSRRAQSVVPLGKPAVFALEEGTIAGDPQAPVRMVVYACARCPFCSVIVPALYREITEGALKGRAQLHLQPFPLRDHAGSSEGGLALIGAARLGQFWPFVVRLYQQFDAFSPGVLPEWAAGVGMERAAFEEMVVDPKVRAALVSAKQEGIRNKVEATPALFINGRRYVYELQPEVIADVVLEVHESMAAGVSGKP